MEIQKPQLDVALAEHDQLTLPISPELDISIRKQDLFGKEENLTQEEESLLAQNLDRLIRLHQHFQEHQDEELSSSPLHFNHTQGLAQDYFGFLEEVSKNYATSSINLFLGSPLRNKDHYPQLLRQAMRVARDAILVIGPDNYDTAAQKLSGEYARQINPEYLLQDPIEQSASYYRDVIDTYWSKAPLGWARDCLMLALHPATLKGIQEYKKITAKSMRRDVLGWSNILAKKKQIAENPPEKKFQNKESQPKKIPPQIQIPEEHAPLLETVLKALKKSKRNIYGANSRAPYAPTKEQGHASLRKGELQRFTSSLFAHIPKDALSDDFQYQIARAAADLAQKIIDARDKSSDSLYPRLPKNVDLTHVIRAAKNFEKLALLRSAIEHVDKETHRKYMIEPDPKNANEKQIKVISQKPPRLICQKLKPSEITTSEDLDEKDKNILHELLERETVEREKIIKNFTITIPRKWSKLNEEKTEALHTLYVLSHFLCLAGKELAQQKKKPGAVQTEIHEAVNDLINAEDLI